MHKIVSLIPHPQTAAQIFEDQVVIALADSSQVIVLNETGTLIWQLCDGEHSFDQIVQAVVDVYDVSFDDASRDAQILVDQLLDADALIKYELEQKV